MGALLSQNWFILMACFIGTNLARAMPMESSRQEDCPQNCSCSVTRNTIVIDCGGNQSVGVEEVINSLILKHTAVTELVINNTDLTHVETVDLSLLGNLTALKINNDTGITHLPKGFINSNRQLQYFEMIYGRLEELHEGVFLGLNQLQTIHFYPNRISRIHPKTFIGLGNIREINLAYNRLTEVDIWPLYIMVHTEHPIKVELKLNRIEQFTNLLNWTYNCGMTVPKGSLGLRNNNIHHFKEITDGFEVTAAVNVLCMFRRNTFKVFLQRNPLVCDCVDFRFYTVIHDNWRIDPLVCDTAPDKALVDKLIQSIDLTDFVCDIHGGCPKGCRCLQEPANRTLHINCQGQGLRSLPQSLPQFRNMTGYDLKLNYQSNQLTELEPRQYFNRLFTADFAGNRLESVNLHAVQQLVNASTYIYLDNNELKGLPVEIQHVNLSHVVTLTLHGNPWACDCHNKWLLSWMQSVRNKTMRPESILCDSPSWLHKKNIYSLTEYQFCDDPRYDKIVDILIYSISAALGTLVLVVLPVVVGYKKRVWVYKKFQWHPFDWDECDGEDKQFDAFVSYANEDEAWVLGFINDLEQNGFKILFHRRDFD